MLDKLRVTSLAVAAAMSMIATASSAATINFDYGDGSQSSNNADLGTSATLDVTFVDEGGNVRLSVSATNTSDISTGGFLTAFGFLLPNVTGVISSVMDAAYSLTEFTSVQTLSNFSLELNAGAGTGGDYEGGGSPNGAIGIGETGIYSFLLDTDESAASLEGLFFAADPNSAVRFRGLLVGEGSDKLTNTPVSPVPLPAAGWMLIAAVGGLAAVKRRRN